MSPKLKVCVCGKFYSEQVTPTYIGRAYILIKVLNNNIVVQGYEISYDIDRSVY